MQPCVSEEEQIAANPVPSIRCDQGEGFGRLRNGDIDFHKIGLLELQFLEHLFRVDID